jgi:hypothetical protein
MPFHSAAIIHQVCEYGGMHESLRTDKTTRDRDGEGTAAHGHFHRIHITIRYMVSNPFEPV